MKVINIEINKIKPTIPFELVELPTETETIYPIVINKDFFVIDGHKRLKALAPFDSSLVQVLMIEDADNYKNFAFANKHRQLTIFEQYTLYKNGVDIKISGIIPRDYDILDKIELLKRENLALLISQKINSKNIISLLFLDEQKQSFLFKILEKHTLTNNEIRGFLDNLTHLSIKDVQEYLNITDKNEFITSFYKKAKPFIFRNNESIKKINNSLPSKTTIRENTAFELCDFELNLTFSSFDELKLKVEKLSQYIKTDIAKQQIDCLGE